MLTRRADLEALDADLLLRAKQWGFSDRQLAEAMPALRAVFFQATASREQVEACCLPYP